MPLVTTEKMFKAAYDGGFAVGAFNVNNMELLQAIIEAAKAEKAPLILPISKGARAYANIKYLKAMIDVAVAETNLPIVIHCDDGDTFELQGGDRVRLLSIDTPEKGEPFYNEAQEYLSALTLDSQVDILNHCNFDSGPHHLPHHVSQKREENEAC